VYKAADYASSLLSLDVETRSTLLIAAPKWAQAGFAALGDWFTWKLAAKIYGADSTATLATVSSPSKMGVWHMDRLAFTRTDNWIAMDDDSESLAMVLFSPNILQLARDDTYSCRPLLLAMGPPQKAHVRKGKSERLAYPENISRAAKVIKIVPLH
jgi:hypothetical protein